MQIAADSVLAEIQSHADRASSAWGKSALQPWDGERIAAYRRRVAREHQAASPAWKDVDLRKLSGQALRTRRRRFSRIDFGEFVARDLWRDLARGPPPRSGHGHLVKEYYGEPRAWLCQFSGGQPRLARFRFDRTSGA